MIVDITFTSRVAKFGTWRLRQQDQRAVFPDYQVLMLFPHSWIVLYDHGELYIEWFTRSSRETFKIGRKLY